MLVSCRASLLFPRHISPLLPTHSAATVFGLPLPSAFLRYEGFLTLELQISDFYAIAFFSLISDQAKNKKIFEKMDIFSILKSIFCYNLIR